MLFANSCSGDICAEERLELPDGPELATKAVPAHLSAAVGTCAAFEGRFADSLRNSITGYIIFSLCLVQTADKLRKFDSRGLESSGELRMASTPEFRRRLSSANFLRASFPGERISSAPSSE